MFTGRWVEEGQRRRQRVPSLVEEKNICIKNLSVSISIEFRNASKLSSELQHSKRWSRGSYCDSKMSNVCATFENLPSLNFELCRMT